MNNVTHFLRFFTPPSPLSPIMQAYGVTSPFGRSSPSELGGVIYGRPLSRYTTYVADQMHFIEHF